MDVFGDGELASSSTQAQLTVLHNDDPVNLRDTVLILEASEGDAIELVVTRGGHANGRLSLCLSAIAFNVPFVWQVQWKYHSK